MDPGAPRVGVKYSLYIHIPFCGHRCAYCDFNTYAGQEDLIAAYVDALVQEIQYVGSQGPERLAVDTIFFGGGTPSLLTPGQFRSVLETMRCHFDLEQDVEITTEANPGTVSYGALAELNALGVNRISFGAQSANGEELRLLERTHTFLDVMDAVASARRAGFDNLNLDLIYGLPQQELEIWKTTVRRVLDLCPEHISAYSLTLEHGTPFGRWSARGLLPLPDADAAAEMYEWASDTLEAAGYRQYEISNWAKAADGLTLSVGAEQNAGRPVPALACRHNLGYWRCKPYLGIGAGAHGYANGYRYSNVLRIKTYIERLATPGESPGGSAKRFPLSPATVNQHRQTVQDDMSEFMIMGLRLTQEGVSPRTFKARFEQDLTAVYSKEISDLVALGLLERCLASESLRLTKRGRLLGNQVFVRFV